VGVAKKLSYAYVEGEYISVEAEAGDKWSFV
jgi:hypothetical protein